jgi:hypothetical protein
MALFCFVGDREPKMKNTIQLAKNRLKRIGSDEKGVRFILISG